MLNAIGKALHDLEDEVRQLAIEHGIDPDSGIDLISKEISLAGIDDPYDWDRMRTVWINVIKNNGGAGYCAIALNEINKCKLLLIFSPSDADKIVSFYSKSIKSVQHFKEFFTKKKTIPEIFQKISAKQRSDKSRAAARSRHEKSEASADKRLVEACWLEWKSHPGRYRSQDAFALDMLSKCSVVISEQTVKRWCREWKTTHGAE